MSSHQSPVGAMGVVIVATRGAGGPGEVLLKLGGGTEAYMAWSEEPLALGTEIAVYDIHGERSVDVMQLHDGAGSELEN